MGKYLDLIRNYIDKGCKENDTIRDIKHYERTLYWLLRLKPDADEALQIAAYSHDAERVFRSAEYTNISKSAKGFRDEDHLKHHQDIGAKLISDFLLEHGATGQLAKKVWVSISKHEVGGNDDQNLLKDADSLSFFENNVGFFLTRQVEKMGKEKVKDKFNWMYERITSPKAKKIAKPRYLKALQKLD
jgi:hypothetical protein